MYDGTYRMSYGGGIYLKFYMQKIIEKKGQPDFEANVGFWSKNQIKKNSFESIMSVCHIKKNKSLERLLVGSDVTDVQTILFK